jgi:ubiquitin
MSITNCQKFKGEIENYLSNGINNIESKMDAVFSALNFKTWLCKCNIIKKDGYHASHLLFILMILPLLKVKTVHSFCKKHWDHWSTARKDTLYRFKQNARFRWRSFMFKTNGQIFNAVELDQIAQQERYFVIDDTILSKLGRKIENVSFIHDHNLGRSVLGFCIVLLGLFTAQGFYPIDFAYCFGKKRHGKSPEENIGDPRKSSGQRSFEAKHYTKLQLALMMIQRSVDCGIVPGYVLFDSWYAWPVLINGIRQIKNSIHVVCRLKDSNVQYEYKGKKYKLSELYQKVKHQLKKDKRSGLRLKRVRVNLPQSDETAVIVFSKGYREPETDTIKSKKKMKQCKWTAFLSTDTTLHAATIIKKYIKRWPIEVCFKECKQILELGKDQSNDFNAQVFATTATFLRYNLLNYLNHFENYATLGELFDHMADQSATTTYAHRLWEFFRGLFLVSFSTIFDLFKINEDFHNYLDALTESLTELRPFQGCET